jgi:hypothetical protein
VAANSMAAKLPLQLDLKAALLSSRVKRR